MSDVSKRTKEFLDRFPNNKILTDITTIPLSSSYYYYYYYYEITHSCHANFRLQFHFLARARHSTHFQCGSRPILIHFCLERNKTTSKTVPVTKWIVFLLIWSTKTQLILFQSGLFLVFGEIHWKSCSFVISLLFVFVSAKSVNGLLKKRSVYDYRENSLAPHTRYVFVLSV